MIQVCVCGIFVDLQKAFDTVDYEILIIKSSFYDIGRLENKLFLCFLEQRKKIFNLRFLPDTRINQCDVTQDSSLGPYFIFIIYQ